MHFLWCLHPRVSKRMLTKCPTSFNVIRFAVWVYSPSGLIQVLQKILAFADLSFAFSLLLFPPRIETSSVEERVSIHITGKKKGPGLMHSLVLCRFMLPYRLPSPSQSNTTVPQWWACFCWFGQGLCDGYWLPTWLHLQLTKTPHWRAHL